MKQSIRQSRSGRRSSRTRETMTKMTRYLRLKVTEGYQREEGFTTSRAPFIPVLYPRGYLCNGPWNVGGLSVTTSFAR